MEEFLVGIKQKECIFLTMGRNQRTFRNLKEATREIIHFTKNTWGFMPVKVHVSGDFILTYEVMLANHKDHAENRRVADKTIASIIKGFLTYKADGKDLTAWADETREKLKGLDIYSEDGDVYPLFDAHLNLLCKESENMPGTSRKFMD